LEPTLGHEQRGRRPVLVLSTESFNKLTGTPLIATITNGGDFARRNLFAVSLEGLGSQTTGVVRCDQIRSLDLSERRARFVETLPQALVGEVLAKVYALLEYGTAGYQ
jgi:mRNA-degrading endonuclease toxin of MazEF toxin-antitoxin module